MRKTQISALPGQNYNPGTGYQRGNVSISGLQKYFRKESFSSIISVLAGTKERIYITGLVVINLITLKEIHSHGFNNFQIFVYGSRDFWNGLDPYNAIAHKSISGKMLDKYLYGPLFSILFTPFTVLPGQIGVLLWNMLNYTIFYISVFTLPEKLGFKTKRLIFFYSVLLLFAAILSTQFNPLVAAFFLLSFTLLENGRYFFAILLIMVSGFTKIYGASELILLLFYPKLLRNLSYAALIAVFLFVIPSIHIPLSGLIGYYESWIRGLEQHIDKFNCYSIYRPAGILYSGENYDLSMISLAIFMVIGLLSIVRKKEISLSLPMRARVVGIIMSWVILFSTASEKNTYLIAIAGYIIWFCSINASLFDKFLLWSNFVLLELLPVDFLCPQIISGFILDKLNLGLIVFTITFIVMFWKTYILSEQTLVKEIRANG